MSAKQHQPHATRRETTMANVRPNSMLFSRRDIERVYEHAKARRSDYFRENRKPVMRGLLAAAVVCALMVIALFGGRPSSQRALEGTVLMEQVTARLANAKTIAPDTVREISRLLLKADYDCNQTACDAVVEMRNRVARDHLSSVLNRAVHSDELAEN